MAGQCFLDARVHAGGGKGFGALGEGVGGGVDGGGMAGYHRSERGNCLVVGLETPDLLAAALRTLPQAEHAERMVQALDVMREALQYHVDAVQRIVRAMPLDAGWTYVGMDTSAAPSKNCTSMVEVYRLLGVPYFGAAGTVEASALLTRLFKSVKDVEAVGFSGLMLAVTKNEGLAATTRAGQFDIRALLTYSAVCGIGQIGRAHV